MCVHIIYKWYDVHLKGCVWECRKIMSCWHTNPFTDACLRFPMTLHIPAWPNQEAKCGLCPPFKGICILTHGLNTLLRVQCTWNTVNTCNLPQCSLVSAGLCCSLQKAYVLHHALIQAPAVTVKLSMHLCMHAYIHTYIHTHIHTYIHTYMYTYIRTYVHTYIRTYVLVLF